MKARLRRRRRRSRNVQPELDSIVINRGLVGRNTDLTVTVRMDDLREYVVPVLDTEGGLQCSIYLPGRVNWISAILADMNGPYCEVFAGHPRIFTHDGTLSIVDLARRGADLRRSA